jgi:membrane-associated phospholipid phosphatase
VTIAFRFQPGITKRTVLIAAGVIAAALIGLSRVYLRVHWLSDVTSGWGLGAAAFALAGSVALVIVHIRHNPARDDGPPDARRGATARAR